MEHQLKGNLQQAIKDKQFLLHYQPKVHLGTGEIVAMEALLRWKHPDLGMIEPKRFLPIAEETGDVISIGKWVLTEACRQNKKWHEKGYELVVSVNLSPLQFSQANLAAMITEILQDTRLEPQYLEIELPESYTNDCEKTITMLKELKSIGVRLGIDDFGIGIWSLHWLSEFPIDSLKLDQSFVRDLHHDHKNKAIVKAVLSMARHLNLNIVAKGIETREQLCFLQQQSCHYGQGYLLSKPKAAIELEAHFKEIQEVANIHQVVHHEWADGFLKKVRKEADELGHLQKKLFALKRKLAKSLENRNEM